MFAIGIPGLNLGNTTVKYFDIALKQINYGPHYTLINSTSVPLEPCSLKHIDFDP